MQVATLDKRKRKTKGSAGGLAVGCEALKHNRKIEKLKVKRRRGKQLQTALGAWKGPLVAQKESVTLKRQMYKKEKEKDKEKERKGVAHVGHFKPR